MRMRSTGLGRTELVGHFEGIARKGDYLVLSVRTTAPVRWHVRTALSRKDAIEMLKLVLRPSILIYFLSSLLRREEGQAPDEY
jgi:hypothetical protein